MTLTMPNDQARMPSSDAHGTPGTIFASAAGAAESGDVTVELDSRLVRHNPPSATSAHHARKRYGTWPTSR